MLICMQQCVVLLYDFVFYDCVFSDELACAEWQPLCSSCNCRCTLVICTNIVLSVVLVGSLWCASSSSSVQPLQSCSWVVLLLQQPLGWQQRSAALSVNAVLVPARVSLNGVGSCLRVACVSKGSVGPCSCFYSSFVAAHMCRGSYGCLSHVILVRCWLLLVLHVLCGCTTSGEMHVLWEWGLRLATCLQLCCCVARCLWQFRRLGGCLLVCRGSNLQCSSPAKQPMGAAGTAGCSCWRIGCSALRCCIASLQQSVHKHICTHVVSTGVVLSCCPI